MLICFFLSGATGLVYQVLWSRRLTLIFGVTVLAVSTVLAAFMAGLALGSLIFGPVADRRRDPLRLYAALEGAIGLWCFATPWLFQVIESAYVALHPSLVGSPLLLRLARFGLSLLVLLPPTMLMGGTLPALTRALSRRLASIGGDVAALYGTNTMGAMVGAVTGGFLLIPAVGIMHSIYLTAVLNLAIGLLAWALYAAWTDVPEAAPAPDEAEEAPDRRPVRGIGRLLAAYGLCGAASMIYEVGWTRVLSLSLGTSTYAFSTMLAAFLGGIGLGSVVLARWRPIAVDRLRALPLTFGLVIMGIAVLVTLITPALDRLPFAFLTLFELVGARFWLLQGGVLLIALMVMLAPALLMGYAFPLVARLATESVGVAGRRVAGVYAANTIGTVIGSFVAGFFLIPAVGVRNALAVGVVLNLIVGAGYLISSLQRAPRLAGAALAAGALAAVSWFALPDWNREVLSSGAYVYPGFYLSGTAREIMEQKEVLYYRDALTTTVSVTKVSLPGNDEDLLSLQINGKTDASTGDLSTQLLFAHLPVLLHREPKTVLTVGLASGCTVGALTVYDELERIDVVEIEPAMVEASRFFTSINRDCLADPRVNLVLDDARSHLLVTRERYDLITSEPSNPWISGVANLFTREYFELCRSHLNDGGIYCQWIPLYNLAPEDLRRILGTFGDAFPHCSVWVFPRLVTDAFLVGTRSPLQIDLVSMVERSGRDEVRGDLDVAGVDDLWGLLSGYMFGSEVVASVSGNAQRNTDDFPIIEFTSPMTLHTYTGNLTTSVVLELGAVSTPPVGRFARPAGDGYEDLLCGLSVGPPWGEPGEGRFVVTRDAERFIAGDRVSAIRCGARTSWRLGDARAEIHAFRWGLKPPELIPDRPDGDPDLTLRTGDDVARVWLRQEQSDRPGGWTCRLTGPEGEAVYAIEARPADDREPPDPGQALGALSRLDGPLDADR